MFMTLSSLLIAFSTRIIKNNKNNFKRIFRITIKDVIFCHVSNTAK